MIPARHLLPRVHESIPHLLQRGKLHLHLVSQAWAVNNLVERKLATSTTSANPMDTLLEATLVIHLTPRQTREAPAARLLLNQTAAVDRCKIRPLRLRQPPLDPDLLENLLPHLVGP